MSAGGDVSQHALGQTSPCGQNDRQVQKHNFSVTSFADGKNGSVAMLAGNRSACVKPQVNLRNSLHKKLPMNN